ncbi:hypothetical protein HK405_003027, partial [Cladochytrium tenue]
MAEVDEGGAGTAAEVAARLRAEDFAAPGGRAYLLEEDVGITAFIDASLPSFTGIIKHRYSDFLVNEIDMEGRIMRLEREAEADAGVKAGGEKEDEVLDPEECYKELAAYLSAETVGKLRVLFEAPENDDDVEPVTTE